ncbi:MAG: carboxypeptidase regulatory-like domain-containing protein [Luteitalea sp.]|nr:carboxypeptidase regulatory-like domain-containing protein [Luteitalea sp.]
MNRNVCVLVALFLAFAVPHVHGQDYRARVQGLVVDPDQAVIPGATVSLLNVSTGVSTVRQTNDTGRYLFDYVEPGFYVLTAELDGFAPFTVENIRVQSRGDVTVDAVLNPGGIEESVTVTETPAAVQFNTTSVSLSVDTKLANELPRFDRNPFKLSLLDPAAVNTRTEMNPYHSWAANSVDLGGGTSLKNDLRVDGSPIGVGHKATYTPPPDAVQEVTILQNSVDAESGHSGGGVVSITMKSGTNEWQGSAFFAGRYPELNAITNRTTGDDTKARTAIVGGVVGHPIVRNRVFHFASYEQWRPHDPLSIVRTMPTARERAGDFSQSYNPDGSLRVIYDPSSTTVDPATGTVTRTPFPGNRIPADRIDPLAGRLMDSLWEPNGTGDDITGVNNYETSATRITDYKNFSNRVDWNVNDAWRVYGRFSRIHTIVETLNPTPNDSPAFGPLDMSSRHALSVSGDALWTVNDRTLLNFHGDYHSLVDDYGAPGFDVGPGGWSDFWPNNPWYQSFETGFPVYHPRFNIGGSHFGGHTVFWYQHPNSATFSAKLSQQRGAHYWKVGFETRRSGGETLVTGTTGFFFDAATTADTYINPDTRQSGHPYASFLLGALAPNSLAVSKPVKRPRTEFYAGFIQDDIKVSQRLTLNLGLRYEFETAWHDPDHNMSRFLDLTQPIPEMEANPPQIPEAASALMAEPYSFNGAWTFTDGDNPGMWDAPKAAFMPRAGLALRIDDKTALRVGYARYVVPTEYNFSPSPFAGFEALNFLEPPYLGFDATQSVGPPLQGIPQARLNDPFPADSNPLIPPLGKDNGRYLGLGGDNLVWYYQDLKPEVNDRINVSLQRELLGELVTDVTYFVNFGHNVPHTRNLNQMDPRLSYEHGSALDATVPNPFYQYLTPETFPGPLRNQETVSLGELLRPYPQYGGLHVAYTPERRSRYHALQISARRPYRSGYSFLFGYNYHRQRTEEYFDAVANYLNEFTFQDAAGQGSPRHRLSAAGIYELPFGRDRAYLANLHPALDAVVGAWQVSGAFYFNSGEFLRFGPALVDGDPTLDNPTPDRWFDTSKFQQQPDYTPRTNPLQYPSLTGPVFWTLDATLTKQFRLQGSVRAEFKLAAYNATNRLNRANPNTGVLNSTFGRSLAQRGGTSGRQLELGLKILF